MADGWRLPVPPQIWPAGEPLAPPAGGSADVFLVHGFGASSGHWRRTGPALEAAGHRAFALDLLGFGASDKPVGYSFSTEDWAEQVADYVRAHAAPGAPVVLVGNSIGSLVALAAADRLSRQEEGVEVAGVALLNCAGGLNNKGAADDLRVAVFLPLFWLIDWLLSIPSVARALFDRFRSRENVAQVLAGVYGNQSAVDDELVELIYRPSEDAGALETFVSVITGDPGPRPEALAAALPAGVPLLVLWGDADPFTPLGGPVGEFFAADLCAPGGRPGARFAELAACGHCPHDDRPEAVHAELLPWLQACCPRD